MDVNTKSYWKGNGRFEEEYEELLASPNVKWTKEEQEIKYRYYRTTTTATCLMGQTLRVYLKLRNTRSCS